MKTMKGLNPKIPLSYTTVCRSLNFKKKEK